MNRTHVLNPLYHSSWITGNERKAKRNKNFGRMEIEANYSFTCRLVSLSAVSLSAKFMLYPLVTLKLVLFVSFCQNLSSVKAGETE